MHSPRTPHPRELAARAVKVAGLLTAIEVFGLHRHETVTAEELTTWPAHSWDLLSMIAGVRTPSQTTIDAVVAGLASREADAGKDPFRGLPGAKKVPARSTDGPLAVGDTVQLTDSDRGGITGTVIDFTSGERYADVRLSDGTVTAIERVALRVMRRAS